MADTQKNDRFKKLAQKMTFWGAGATSLALPSHQDTPPPSHVSPSLSVRPVSKLRADLPAELNPVDKYLENEMPVDRTLEDFAREAGASFAAGEFKHVLDIPLEFRQHIIKENIIRNGAGQAVAVIQSLGDNHDKSDNIIFVKSIDPKISVTIDIDNAVIAMAMDEKRIEIPYKSGDYIKLMTLPENAVKITGGGKFKLAPRPSGFRWKPSGINLEFFSADASLDVTRVVKVKGSNDYPYVDVKFPKNISVKCNEQSLQNCKHSYSSEHVPVRPDMVCLSESGNHLRLHARRNANPDQRNIIAFQTEKSRYPAFTCDEYTQYAGFPPRKEASIVGYLQEKQEKILHKLNAAQSTHQER